MRIRHLFISAALVITTAAFSGCAKTEKADRNFFAMDTFMTATVYGSSAEAAADAAVDEIYRLERLLTAYDDKSPICILNDNSGEWTEMPDEAAGLIARALEISEITGGSFDITVEPFSRTWGFGTGEYRVPGAEEINRIIPLTGYDKVHTENGRVMLDAGAAISLGGIAKGYAGDRVREILKQNGVTGAVISLGGNISTVGVKPGGSKWNIGIRDPKDASGVFCSVEAGETNIITSGAYQRYFEADGKTYGHIIDPHTGMPADSGLISATVICDDGTLADALSTALYVMGKDKAEMLWRELSSFGMILVDEELNVYYTPDLEGSIHIENGSYTPVQIRQ